MTLPARPTDARASWLTNRDRRAVAVAFLALAAAATAARSPLGLAWLVGVALAGLLAGRVPWRTAVARGLLLLLSVAPLVAVGVWHRPDADPTAVPLRALALGWLGLVLTEAVPFHELVGALVSLGLPRVPAELLRVTHRQLGHFTQEVRRTRVALRTRGFRVGGSWRTTRVLATQLALVALRGEARGERVAAAMRCRGYAGSPPEQPPRRLAPGDWALVAGAVLAAVVAVVVPC